MAWLQSSFTSHQLLVDNSGSNHKRTSKGSTGVKNSDPDKSDTPLLQDISHSPEGENPSSSWLKSTSNTSEKKQNVLCNSSKPSFLPHGLFDKSLGNSKGKMQISPNSSSRGKKHAENMSLLSDEDKKKNPLFNDDNDDNDEDDSDDDDWCIPRLGGYQKVRPCAE